MATPKKLKSIQEISLVIENGLSLRFGEINNSKDTRNFLLKEIARAAKIIGANKTFDSDEELELCVESILNEFPHLKIEEVRTVFDNLITGKYGKFFERLKVAEVLEAFRAYEISERCVALEKRNALKNDYIEREIKAFEESLKNYKHEKVFLNEENRKSIAELKQEILSDADLKHLKL